MKSLENKLPNKETFCSFLTDKQIGDKEYKHVLNVWNRFEMKTMKDYHDLYLKCDILLLEDVFRNLEIIASRITDYVWVIIWAYQS